VSKDGLVLDAGEELLREGALEHVKTLDDLFQIELPARVISRKEFDQSESESTTVTKHGHTKTSITKETHHVKKTVKGHSDNNNNGKTDNEWNPGMTNDNHPGKTDDDYYYNKKNSTDTEWNPGMTNDDNLSNEEYRKKKYSGGGEANNYYNGDAFPAEGGHDSSQPLPKGKKEDYYYNEKK